MTNAEKEAVQIKIQTRKKRAPTTIIIGQQVYLNYLALSKDPKKNKKDRSKDTV